jgi:hypothetical protein
MMLTLMLNTLEAAQAVARELSIQAKPKAGRAKKVRADQKFMVETVRRSRRTSLSPPGKYTVLPRRLQ